MTIATLAELNGLYARWSHRVDLRLKQWEIQLLRLRIEELGLKLGD